MQGSLAIAIRLVYIAALGCGNPLKDLFGQVYGQFRCIVHQSESVILLVSHREYICSVRLKQLQLLKVTIL